NNVRARLKKFAYKIIFYDALQIPEEVDIQGSVLCGVCRDEINPQISEPITILICGTYSIAIVLNKKNTTFFLLAYLAHQAGLFGGFNGEERFSETQSNENEGRSHDIFNLVIPEEILQSHCIIPENQLNNSAPSSSNIDDSVIFPDPSLNHVPGSNTNHISGSCRPHRRRYVHDSAYRYRGSRNHQSDHVDDDIHEEMDLPGDHVNDDVPNLDEETDLPDDHVHEEMDSPDVDNFNEQHDNELKNNHEDINNKKELIVEKDESTSVSTEDMDIDIELDQSSESLVRLYQKANHAEKYARNGNQKEIWSWFYYGEKFENRVQEILNNDSVTEKKARSKVYKEVEQHLPGITRANLCQKTKKTRYIYTLFREIGTDKIKRIKSYSADSIARLNKTLIQSIVSGFLSS
ncbi:1428_t:CDS:2, partial [Funneliformis mosseae]